MSPEKKSHETHLGLLQRSICMLCKPKTSQRFVVAFCLASYCIPSARAFGQQTWPPDGPYEPRHAYAALTAVVQDTLSLPPIGGSEAGYWFHVATTNYIQPSLLPIDRSLLSNLVNRLPTSDFRISGTLQDQGLDDWYEHLLENISSIEYEKSSDIKAAEKVLFKLDPTSGEVLFGEVTPAFSNYILKLSKYNEASFRARDANTRQLIPDQEAANWLQAKNELEEAMSQGVFDAVKSLQQFEQRNRRLRNIDRLSKLMQYSSGSRVDRSFLAGKEIPEINFIPPVETWSDEKGWYETSFSNVDVPGRYERHVQRFSECGVDIGFVTFRLGKSAIEDRYLKAVHGFSYKVKLKRVVIERPWFDHSLLTGRDWTWHRKGTGAYPLISKAPAINGAPIKSADVYNGKEIGLPSVPVELILAKDLEIQLLADKAEWERAKQAAVVGTGTLFGVIPFEGKWNSHILEVDKGKEVILVANRQDVAILGALSRICLPAPNPDRKLGNWGEDAWKPWE